MKGVKSWNGRYDPTTNVKGGLKILARKLEAANGHNVISYRFVRIKDFWGQMKLQGVSKKRGICQMMLASIKGPAWGYRVQWSGTKTQIGSQGMSRYYRKRFLCPYSAPYSLYRPYNRSQHHRLNPPFFWDTLYCRNFRVVTHSLSDNLWTCQLYSYKPPRLTIYMAHIW